MSGHTAFRPSQISSEAVSWLTMFLFLPVQLDALFLCQQPVFFMRLLLLLLCIVSTNPPQGFFFFFYYQRVKRVLAVMQYMYTCTHVLIFLPAFCHHVIRANGLRPLLDNANSKVHSIQVWSRKEPSFHKPVFIIGFFDILTLLCFLVLYCWCLLLHAPPPPFYPF